MFSRAPGALVCPALSSTWCERCWSPCSQRKEGENHSEETSKRVHCQSLRPSTKQASSLGICSTSVVSREVHILQCIPEPHKLHPNHTFWPTCLCCGISQRRNDRKWRSVLLYTKEFNYCDLGMWALPSRSSLTRLFIAFRLEDW